MRTKHLLYTMTLASVFAACTQDEFVTEGGNSNPLEGRKSLGKITLVEAEGPSTRWTVDNFNTITPEVGDGFSYFLVDEPLPELAGQHDYPIDNYQLVNHVHTNYIFKKNGNGWDSEANLVEGNYLLVGPAQEGKLDRKPVEIKLPAKQTLDLGADGKVNPLSIIEEFVENEYPIYIGHRFLSEGSNYNNVLPARYSIFAYPEITVKNSERNDELTPVVTKVILKRNNAEKPFIINAPLNNVKAARLLTNESFKAAGNDKKNQFVVGGWEAYMNDTLGIGDLRVKQASNNEAENTQAIPDNATYEVTMLNEEDEQALSTFKYNNGLKGFTSDLLAAQPTSTSQYIVIKMPGNGVEVPRGTEFKFNAVIPADQYVMDPKGTDLEIFAVLSTGEVYKKKMKSNSTVEMYPGKRYPDQDYIGMTVKPAVGTDGLPARGEYFTIDVNEGGTDGVSDYVKCSAEEIGDLGNVDAVKTTEDLIAVITKSSSTRTLNVTVEGNNVVYNKAVNDAVANTKCQIINILGHIKIDGGEKGITISDKVSFEDAAIDNGAVVFNSASAKLGTVLVSKKASFELRKAAEAAKIYNVGTLKLYTNKFTNVYNYAALDVYADMTDIGAGTISNGYDECGDQSEIISDPINLKPTVTVKAVKEGDEVLTGKYKISRDLNYPITIESIDKDNKATLILGANISIVEKGSIVNNGTISGKDSSDPAKETLTVQRGNGETLTNEVNGEIKSDVIIEGANYLLAAIGAGKNIPADYKAAAQVTNNGILNVVKVDGKLIMKSANSRINGTIEAETQTEGEIDNTAKGVIVNTPAVGVKVYAVFNGMDWTTKETRGAERRKIDGYKNYKVNLIRLTGEVKVGDGDTYFMKHDIYGGDGISLEFAAGSSLSMGFGKLISDLNITVSAPDIQWNGKTRESSTFDLTGEKNRGLYLDYEADKVAEGYVDFNNCAGVTELNKD